MASILLDEWSLLNNNRTDHVRCRYTQSDLIFTEDWWPPERLLNFQAESDERSRFHLSAEKIEESDSLGASKMRCDKSKWRCWAYVLNAPASLIGSRIVFGRHQFKLTAEPYPILKKQRKRETARYGTHDHTVQVKVWWGRVPILMVLTIKISSGRYKRRSEPGNGLFVNRCWWLAAAGASCKEMKQLQVINYLTVL